MPAILPVRPQAHVLGQAIQRPRTLALRLVAGDSIRHFLQRIEARRLLEHEFHDPLHAVGLDPRRDIDQDERRCIHLALARRDQAHPSAHRRPYEHRMRVAKRLKNALQIGDHHVRPIDSIGGPVGIAMAAGIERYRVVSGGAELLARALPGMARLTATMLQDDQRSLGVAP